LINVLASTRHGKLLTGVPLKRLSEDDINWYWTHFEDPSEEEVTLLTSFFHFHSLSIEDCLEHLERPKVDYYETYDFYVLHAIRQETLEPVEVDLFVGKNFVVSFCKTRLEEIDGARQKVLASPNLHSLNSTYIAYAIFDKIVDFYFPAVYKTEDLLNTINEQLSHGHALHLIDRIFDIRTDFLKLRHIVNSMKELLYRIIGSDHLEGIKENKRHYNDIYDHLLKLSDIIESNREVTADVRDNYLSVNAHKMNKIMTFLTIITAVFIPLTFIVGVYGMNFDYMPELRWKYGYFIILGVMAFIGVMMLLWFKRKGWFDIKK
jgi:magnesium transporter